MPITIAVVFGNVDFWTAVIPLGREAVVSMGWRELVVEIVVAKAVVDVTSVEGTVEEVEEVGMAKIGTEILRRVGQQ